MPALDTGMLVGLFVSSILYGIFVVLFVATVYILVYKRSTAKVNTYMICVTCAMFAFTTFMESLAFSRALDAFIYYRDTIGPVYYYEMIISEWKIIAEMVVLLVYSLFADAVLIHRGWVIWRKDFRAVGFNILIWVGTVVVSIIDIVLTTRVSLEIDEPTLELTNIINNYNTAFVVLTLSQNVLMTSIIIFKIWQVNASASSPGTSRRRFMPIIFAMIESASMYAATLAGYLILALLVPIMQDCMTEVLSSMIGITFMLLFVRAAVAQTNEKQLPISNVHRLRPMDTGRPQWTQNSQNASQSQEYVVSADEETAKSRPL